MKTGLLFCLGLILGGFLTYQYLESLKSNPNVETPKGLISPEEAKILSEAYDSRHALISEVIVKRPDNRSSWYALTELKAYLAYADYEAKERGYTLDGLRVYYGAYPNENEETGYTTSFFIPTGQKILSKGSTFGSVLKSTHSDIPGVYGLNKGNSGWPPFGIYPQ